MPQQGAASPEVMKASKKAGLLGIVLFACLFPLMNFLNHFGSSLAETAGTISGVRHLGLRRDPAI